MRSDDVLTASCNKKKRRAGNGRKRNGVSAFSSKADTPLQYKRDAINR